MQESHRKGVAIHPDPESCMASRKATIEALTGAHAGRVLSCEIIATGVPTSFSKAEGHTDGGAIASLPVLARGVSMHARGLRMRGAGRSIATPPPSVSPSDLLNDVGTPVAIISQLNTRPACAPVNASMVALRLAMHDSGSGWIATPFLCDSCIYDSTPVYPGALSTLLAGKFKVRPPAAPTKRLPRSTESLLRKGIENDVSQNSSQWIRRGFYQLDQ